MEPKPSHLTIVDRTQLRRLLKPEALALAEKLGLAISVELRADDVDVPARASELIGALDQVSAQLERLEQLAVVGELAAGVAHETRNLMSGILGFAQLACDQADATHQTDVGYVKTIERDALRCVRLLQRFLDLSRHHDQPERTFAMEELIDDVTLTMAYRLQRKQLALEVAVAPTLAVVRGNRDELRHVLLNLLLNASYESPSGGRIGIEATNVGPGEIEIIVTDSGQGIPAALRDRIFEPFFTTKPAGEGTGLGLSLCRQIVARHGGTIHAVTGPEGARFVIRLPAAEGAPK